MAILLLVQAFAFLIIAKLLSNKDLRTKKLVKFLSLVIILLNSYLTFNILSLESPTLIVILSLVFLILTWIEGTALCSSKTKVVKIKLEGGEDIKAELIRLGDEFIDVEIKGKTISINKSKIISIESIK